MAATFKFNFLPTEQQPLDEGDLLNQNDTKSHITAHRLSIEPSKPLYRSILDVNDHVTVLVNGTSSSIRHIPLQCVKKLIREQPMIDNEFMKLMSITDDCGTDLVPGEYEGGFKIWECTYDLLDFLNSHPNHTLFSDRKVLDLGCGAGLLGIYALIKEACRVDFHDFNHEVLSYITVPNVLLNLPNSHCLDQKCNFYCGDWSGFSSILEQEQGCEASQYHVILTSETIYSSESQEKLLKLFERVLSPEGVVYVAAKNHYFGVGGNVLMFMQLVAKYKLFNCEIVHEITTSLPRFIIRLTWK